MFSLHTGKRMFNYRTLFEKQGYEYPPQNIYLRIFKDEQILEVWTKRDVDKTYKKVCDYEFCATSGKLGPKRQEGDLQIPEGFYYIDRFNPNSNFFLSLGINYPNKSDKILGVKRQFGWRYLYTWRVCHYWMYSYNRR